MLNVLVVYQHLPHYRKGVFLELEQSPGWDVHFAAGRSSRDPGIETIPMTELQRTHELRNTWVGPFLWQRDLMRLLLRPWDIVIFLGDVAYVSTWAGAAVSRLLGRRVAFWTIGWHRPERGPRRLVRVAFYRLAHRLLLYGNVARRIGVSQGYPAERTTIVKNSRDHVDGSLAEDGDRLAAIRAGLREVRLPAVGAVVRLTDGKRLELILEAVARIEQSGGPRLAVVLAGEGPMTESLRQQAAELNVDIHLLGAIYGDEALTEFYQKCLVTVLPSLAGLTTIQSMQYGRPVITHNDEFDQAPEYEAIRCGVTGDLYQKGNVDALAEAVRRWVLKVQESPVEVEMACKEAVREGWTPESSARAIFEAFHPAD